MNLIIIPVFNDWRSLNKLLIEINKNSNHKNFTQILIIDDKSTIKMLITKQKLKKIKKIEVLRLRENIGSQKAIALGLNYVKNKKRNFDFITIMDGDGEDNPKNIDELLKAANNNRNSVIVSCRKERKENFIIQFCYKIHLLITFFFTGQWMSFGNFSCCSYNNLKKILSDNSVWYAYSAAIKKNANIKRVYAARAKRYFDKTRVNFFFLISHSLRIIGVFFKRLIFFSLLYLFIIKILSIKYSIFFNLIIILFTSIIFLTMLLSKKKKFYKYVIKKIK